jgi:predicted secreted Zn-dependent protease
MEGLQRGIVAGSTIEIAELQNWTATARITQGELRYRAIYLYPRWNNLHLMPRYVQAEWQRYTRCLRTHEEGHLRESMPLLREFQRRFDALQIAASGASGSAAERQASSDLMDQIRDLYRELSFRCEQTNQAYDRRTRHGRTQGAQLRTRTTVRRPRRQ